MIGRGRNLSERRDEVALIVRSFTPLRLDRYLRENMVWKSRTRLQRLIRGGLVLVNGRVAKPSTQVRSGDRVQVKLSLGTGIPDYDRMELVVLYEDPWLLAIDKPPGLLVHPVGRHVYDTLLNHLHWRFRERMRAGELHPRLCHRLDADTTGVILVGKQRYVHHSLQWQFESRRVAKEYLALVDGAPARAQFLIDRPLANGKDLASALDGDLRRPAQTRVRVLERFGDGGRALALVAARPLTGRQNQIRVHLAAAGLPIVGDWRYGHGAASPDFPPRYLLHSRWLRVWHPRLKSHLELEAPLPADFQALLERLRGAPGAAPSYPSFA